MEAPGGLLQLCVLAGGQLWGSRGQQVRVGVRLDGGPKGVMAIGLALLHWEEGAAGFGAGHFDPALVTRVTAAGGRGSRGLLGGVAVVKQLVVRCDGLPVVGLRVLPLQLLLLFPPHVIQQDLAVPHSSSSSSSSSPRPSPLRQTRIRLCPSVGQRLRAPEHSAGVRSSGPGLTVYPQSCLLQTALLLWGVDAVQESI